MLEEDASSTSPRQAGQHSDAALGPRPLDGGRLPLLFLILSKIAWGPMLEGLQRREENIRRASTEAQKARDEAKALRDSASEGTGQGQRQGPRNARRRSTRWPEAADEMKAKAQAEIAAERERLQQGNARRQGPGPRRRSGARLPSWPTLVSSKAIRRQTVGRRPPPAGGRGRERDEEHRRGPANRNVWKQRYDRNPRSRRDSPLARRAADRRAPSDVTASARGARVYAEAPVQGRRAKGKIDEVMEELHSLVHDVFPSRPD